MILSTALSSRLIFATTNFRNDQFSYRPIFVATNFLRLIFVRLIFIRLIFVDPGEGKGVRVRVGEGVRVKVA